LYISSKALNSAYLTLPAREDAIRTTVLRFFAAFGPSDIGSCQKFVGRLKLTDIRLTVKQLCDEGRLKVVSVAQGESSLYICANEHRHLQALSSRGDAHARNALTTIGVLLLPAFDALTICLKDKSFWFRDAKTEIDMVWKQSAIVEPVVVSDGYIVGVWRSRVSNSTLTMRVQLFASVAADTLVSIKSGIDARARSLYAFFGAASHVIEYVTSWHDSKEACR